MSLYKKGRLASLCILWLWLLFSQFACSPNQSNNGLQLGPTPTTAPKHPVELVFAGQVADENGRWLNDCVVVLFKNGEEVARTTSRLMESAFSRQGPMDGVFELRIPNVYKLSVAHEVYEQANGRILLNLLPGATDKRYLGTWFDDLEPTATRVLTLPDKQLEYALAVLPMPQATLPEHYAPGQLTFEGGFLVITEEDTAKVEGETVVQVTAVPTANPSLAINVQFKLLPSRNAGQDWHLQMSGYYGTRWEVWEKYVAGRGSSLSWETFKYAVLVHNPHLEADNFVFYPDKTYLLPFDQ